MKLLITAIGKRVQLIRHLKKQFEVIGTDCSTNAPAIHFVDKFCPVSRYTSEAYKDELLGICGREQIDILISVFEQEFFVLDSIRDSLKAAGTFLMLPSRRVLEICNDKWETYRFFTHSGISTPRSFMTPGECPGVFPLFIKPRMGMGSKNSLKVNDREELEFYFKRIEKPIIQEYVDGVEYTIDCICDMEGRPVSIVPRERLEVRAGEVTKTRACRDESLINAAGDVCEKLKAMGPVTIQCIKPPKGEIKFIEINPRMGGGVPLSFEAGVDYCGYFKDLAAGRAIKPDIGNFKELTMLRYDEAVFI